MSEHEYCVSSRVFLDRNALVKRPVLEKSTTIEPVVGKNIRDLESLPFHDLSQNEKIWEENNYSHLPSLPGGSLENVREINWIYQTLAKRIQPKKVLSSFMVQRRKSSLAKLMP